MAVTAVLVVGTRVLELTLTKDLLTLIVINYVNLVSDYEGCMLLTIHTHVLDLLISALRILFCFLFHEISSLLDFLTLIMIIV